MPRTTQTLVEAILSAGGNYRCGVSLTPFIRTASHTIDRAVACANAKGVTQSSDVWLDIETWYAAHVYTRSDPTYKSRSTLRASGALNTDGTEFLKQALALDSSGCLAEIVNSLDAKRAKIFWGGKTLTQERSYRDRMH